jgi:hypothetical protein
MTLRNKLTVATLAAAAFAAPAYSAVTVTLEAPGVQNTTVAVAGQVEGFEGTVSPAFSGFGVRSANEYGGAGGVGQYGFTDGTGTITIAPAPANFLGLWVSALNSSNGIRLFSGTTELFAANLIEAFNGAGGTSSYFGNPNPNFLNADSGEAFAYFNFSSDTLFDRVELYGYNGRLELDNVVVGTTGGAAAVPEPATWAMMIGGFGLVGGVLRRQRKVSTRVRFA